MAKRKPNLQSMDEYISMQPPAMQIVLERVRSAIGKVVRDAEECISYQIPAFKLNGRVLLYFAGWKEHYSVYPASDAMMAAFPGELDRYRVSKGTLRFLLSEPVPVKLIARIAKFRAEELAERKPAKAAAKKQP
ncbi:MAG: iron chaperone [Acidobacteriaceae bacterium]